MQDVKSIFIYFFLLQIRLIQNCPKTSPVQKLLLNFMPFFVWFGDMCLELVWMNFEWVIHTELTLCGWWCVEIQEFFHPIKIFHVIHLSERSMEVGSWQGWRWDWGKLVGVSMLRRQKGGRGGGALEARVWMHVCMWFMLPWSAFRSNLIWKTGGWIALH